MDDLTKTLSLNRRPDSDSAPAAQVQTARPPNPAPNVPTDKREESFRHGQSKILQMIARNSPLSSILNELVLLIEAQSPGMLCSVLLLSQDGDHVIHGAAPSLPEDYVKAVDGGSIGPKHGSCGTAMYRGAPVIVTDIFSDPLWEDYRDLAAASGLRACWSTPIMSGRGKVLGSFAMYYSEPRTPTGDEAGLTEVATRIAGLAIEHQAAREVLARTQAELAQASYAASTGKVAASIVDEVNDYLRAIMNDTKKCLELLDEDKPDISQFRQPLKTIENTTREALNVVARIQKQ